MKATHFGTCQICGRQQKLPSGRLSLHGYTKQWGFFSGSCFGSCELPFEQSKDLIANRIVEVELQADKMSRESVRLKLGEQLKGNKAWNHEYIGSGFGYAWQQVELFAQENSFSDGGKYLSYSYKNAKGQLEPIREYGEDITKSLDSMRTHFNRQYAEYYLDKQVSDLRRYVDWQSKRVANWKPAELQLVTA